MSTLGFSRQDGREVVLQRVQRALRAVPALPRIQETQLPVQPGPRNRKALIAEFRKEWEALQGKFITMPRADAVTRIAALLRELKVRRLLTWNEEHLPVRDLAMGLERSGFKLEGSVLPRHDPARHARLQQLADIEVGMTGVAAAISQVGALVMPGGAGHGRLASLLPPIHIALLTPDVIFPTFEAWLESQSKAGAVDELLSSSSSLTLIAGPSRSSDIERVLTLGVHGPVQVLAVLLE